MHLQHVLLRRTITATAKAAATTTVATAYKQPTAQQHGMHRGLAQLTGTTHSSQARGASTQWLMLPHARPCLLTLTAITTTATTAPEAATTTTRAWGLGLVHTDRAALHDMTQTVALWD
jgi:hypothetical protein